MFPEATESETKSGFITIPSKAVWDSRKKTESLIEAVIGYRAENISLI